VTDARLQSSVDGAPSIPFDGSVRDALDLIVLTGSPAINVVDSAGRAIGSLDHASISAVLGGPAKLGDRA
jgi:hypothetical protein